MALATDDIIATVTALRDRGVEFLPVPTTYYDDAAGPGGQDRRAGRRARRSSGSWWTATRRLPAPDLHQAGRGPARRCSTRSSSGRAPRASARGTSRRCSRRSSGSRRRAGICERTERISRRCRMPIYHTTGPDPAQAAHRLPAPGRRAVRRGADGARGVHRHLVAALSHPSADDGEDRCGGCGRLKYEADPDQTLRHRHFRTSQVKTGGSPTLDRMPLLFNQDIAMLYVEPDENDAHFYRNAQADELVYVSKGTRHAGDGVRRPALPRGRLPRHPPRHHAPLAARPRAASRPSCWSWRAGATCAGPSGTATSSASSSKARPTASATSAGRPRSAPTTSGATFRILVKQYDGLNEIILDHHPFDVVGWDGYFYPWAFNIYDFEPIVGRVHQPPPVHQTFQGDGFVVCSFCPRPYDFHPEAVPGAVQPQQRGLGRGAVLRLERVHEPEGDRVRQHHPPSRRDSARPASRAAPRRASAPSTPRSWR